MEVIVAANRSGSFNLGIEKCEGTNGHYGFRNNNTGEGAGGIKRFFPNGSDALMDYDRFQAVTVIECICRDCCCPTKLTVIITADGSGRFDGSIVKNIASHGGNRCWDHHISELTTIRESTVTKGGDTVGECNLHQTFTPCKSGDTDGGELPGKFNSDQPCAGIKCSVSNGRNTIREYHGLQGFASKERVFRNR